MFFFQYKFVKTYKNYKRCIKIFAASFLAIPCKLEKCIFHFIERTLGLTSSRRVVKRLMSLLNEILLKGINIAYFWFSIS